MTLDDSDADELAKLVRAARPAAPMDLEARVLAASRMATRRRRAPIAAAVLVLAAAAAVVLVMRPSSTPPEHPGPGSSRSLPPATSPASPPPVPPSPPPALPRWDDPPALLAQLVPPRLAELRACYATPEQHRLLVHVRQRPDDAPRDDARDPVASVAGHREPTTEDACLERVLGGVRFPALPLQLRSIDLQIMIPAGAAPLTIAPLSADDPWRDPVKLVADIIETGRAIGCYPSTPLKGYPRPGTPGGPWILYVAVSRDWFDGPAHTHYVSTGRERGQVPETAKFASCVENRLSHVSLPPLPPNIHDFELVYGLHL